MQELDPQRNVSDRRTMKTMKTLNFHFQQKLSNAPQSSLSFPLCFFLSFLSLSLFFSILSLSFFLSFLSLSLFLYFISVFLFLSLLSLSFFLSFLPLSSSLYLSLSRCVFLFLSLSKIIKCTTIIIFPSLATFCLTNLSIVISFYFCFFVNFPVCDNCKGI